MASPLPIYLDNNATTPVDPRVLEAMLPCLKDRFGNASSRTHRFGWDAEEAVEEARRKVAEAIGARPREIVFTSGATESTNLALKGLFERHRPARSHVITVATEHKATLDTAKWIEKQGGIATILPVDADGLLDLARLEEAIRKETLVVSVMAVNNESGVIQPVGEIAAICERRGVHFHCDAAQAFGKIPVDVRMPGLHLLSVSAHKVYGPKGVGFLWVRGQDPKVEIAEQINGGGHEGGMRSGTLNVPGIVGLGRAAEIARLELNDESARIFGLRRRLLGRLEQSIPGLIVNGHPERRVPGNLNVSVPGFDSESVLMALTDVAISSGSACNSREVTPSYVLKAMGFSDERALSALRFGIGRFNTEAEIDRAVHSLIEVIGRLGGARPGTAAVRSGRGK